MYRGIYVGLVLVTALVKAVSAQSAGAAKLKMGREIYEAGCAGCHGGDGKGARQSTIGFEKPDSFPDFTKCDQTTPEDNWAWKSTIRDGGPSRGFSQIMPSFSGALTSEQMDTVIQYLRNFCKEKGWPRGELNFPLALGTEKAFPEDELVILNTWNATGAPGVTSEIVHEQRLGEKNQIEVSVPVEVVHAKPGLDYGGVGDVGFGLKRVLFSNLQSGSIFSLYGGVFAPTGNKSHALGAGVTTFETYAAFGQFLPWKTFIQMQGGADLPTNTRVAPQTVFLNTAVGKMLNQNHGLGRLWTPMFEFLATRDLKAGAKTDWNVMPEFQVTLSKRQHIRFDVGLLIPATNTAGRQMQVMFYVLWDWQDGKLYEGW